LSRLIPIHLEVSVAHRNARLTVHGRAVLVERVLSGRPVAHVAAELGVSRATGYKWLARYRLEGPAGLVDRSSYAGNINSGRTGSRPWSVWRPPPCTPS